jgi:tRNA-binding EMAP/Myf-like protein
MLNTKVESNYLAKVVELKDIRLHPNANKLSITIIDYQQIITGLSAKSGDLYVYFPLESAINKDYLSFSNSFSKSELNKDQSVKGFFDNKGRVRAVKLRGVLSEGYIVPVTDLVNWLATLGKTVSVDDFKVGTTFDSYDDILICEKYVPATNVAKEKSSKAKLGKQPEGFSKLLKDQFHFHVDTKQLKRCIGNLNTSDIIGISYKLHGTSAVFSHVLCKRKLTWYEKLLKKVGIRIEDKQYDYLFSSRKVIKNVKEVSGGYYKEDVWTATGNQLKEKILPGITLYGEIVGYLPSGSPIQKGFDYGCSPGERRFYVYRITYTSPTGQVFEFTIPQLRRYCEKCGLETVPYYYYGKAKDYLAYESWTDEDDFREALLEDLSKEYLEKDCRLCRNKVPAEGIVLVKESDTFDAYKLKSLRFYEYETKELDAGETNIEDSE